MNVFEIEGGFPLKGTIVAGGNKNAALPCIAATLLTNDRIILKRVPEIEDVEVMFSILKKMGSEIKRLKPGEFSIQTNDIKNNEIPAQMAKDIRASILFAGPLLARTGQVTLPPPGGDIIGRRRLDTHFIALSELGAGIKIDSVYRLVANKLVGKDLFLDEASVTATENAIMAAVTASGITVIQNAASEPHVQDLCNMLNSMNAKISGIGSNILKIEGVKKLSGTEFEIGADYMEIGSLLGLIAVTRGEITIEKINPLDLRMTKIVFAKLGIHWDIEGQTLHMNSGQDLKAVHDMGGMIPKIDDAPWPGFPADLTSIVTVIATQVDGTVLVHEKMFESRMFFVDKLISMGARIVLCDPHRAVISGPSRLRGAALVSPDVRAGMALVIAALCAEGKSVIQNIYQIDRGYENLADRLASLGARIVRKDQDNIDF